MITIILSLDLITHQTIINISNKCRSDAQDIRNTAHPHLQSASIWKVIKQMGEFLHVKTQYGLTYIYLMFNSFNALFKRLLLLTHPEKGDPYSDFQLIRDSPSQAHSPTQLGSTSSPKNFAYSLVGASNAPLTWTRHQTVSFRRFPLF